MRFLNTHVVFNVKTVTTVTKKIPRLLLFSEKNYVPEKKFVLFFFFLFFCSTSLSPRTGIQTQPVEVTKAVSL